MASEKPAEKPAAAPPAAEASEAPAKKSGMKMIVAAAVVLVLEGATVALTMSLASGPKKVIADVPATAPKEIVERDTEVKIIDAKLPNKMEGRLFLYDIQVVAKVSEKNKEKVTELVGERDAEIRDQVRTIIASSDPKSLSEPGLETLKRQISYQLELDIGKDLLKDVLIPKCTPIQAQF
jgi:flagellar basal body-associated protein FliL